jgi:hypothetical protein
MNAITLKRLNMETLHDFLGYFDHRAFLEDPNWDGCYCQFYLNTPEQNSLEGDKAEVNRDSACSRVVRSAEVEPGDRCQKAGAW